MMREREREGAEKARGEGLMTVCVCGGFFLISGL